jgi:hypothetical protein
LPVKVIIKGTQEPEKEKPDKIPIRIEPVKKKQGNNFILIRIKKTFNIMMMDIRMLFNKKLKKEYGDYSRFAELARGKR